MLQELTSHASRRVVRKPAKAPLAMAPRRIFKRNTPHLHGIPEHQIPFPQGKAVSFANLSLILSGDFDIVVQGDGPGMEIVLYS